MEHMCKLCSIPYETGCDWPFRTIMNSSFFSRQWFSRRKYSIVQFIYRFPSSSDRFTVSKSPALRTKLIHVVPFHLLPCLLRVILCCVYQCLSCFLIPANIQVNFFSLVTAKMCSDCGQNICEPFLLCWIFLIFDRSNLQWFLLFIPKGALVWPGS
jgi:hypothetical protein